MKPYLFLYNLAAAGGWAYVLYLTALSVLAGESATEFWQKIEFPLKVVQTAAFLEVLHSLFRLVPSPVFSTLVQVGSRLVLLWGFTNASVVAQAHWSLFLMIGSWALVEVPRYLFYALNLFMAKVPYPLFFLRYNLFIVLYPSGITGELAQIIVTLPFLKATNLVCWYSAVFLVLLYVPGSPFMYFHMMGQRKGAEAKRSTAGRPAPQANGVEFPLDKKGERGTTAINQGAFEAAIAAVDKDAAAAAKKERNWRFGYTKHVVRNVEISAQSPETCLKVAQAGLTYLHSHMEFIRGGKTYKLADAMKQITGTFHTGFVKGTKEKPARFDYEIPYKDKVLKGQEILKQLDKWASYGTIEPECRDAIAAVVKNEKWQDLSDLYFVLLGAGSAMGPLQVLLALGANVIAVDLDRPMIWERLIGLARNSCGTMTFPVKKPFKDVKDDKDLFANAGCNLFTDTPEIKNWLLTVEPDKPLIIGGYAYLDAALFVKVAMAMDAIIEGVCAKRKDTALAFLCSPTDVFVTSEEARKSMIKNHQEAPFWQKLISSISGGRFLVPNAARPPAKSKDGKNSFNVVDGLVVAQGPNYALAKRLQHWRCMLAWSQGHRVSTNIAPSTATRSVVHNKQFAAAYGGMHRFRPMEVMYQETSNAVMGALLIHDMRSDKARANPETPLASPLELFGGAAFHGGIWRMGYKMNSIGEVAALTFYLKEYKPALLGSLAGLIGLVSFGYTKGAPHTWF